MNSDIAIKVEHLTKIYNTRNLILDENGVESNEFYALKDVSFEIKKGESVGVIGPNGSGKSTLLKILAGVTKPTSGSVKIIGRVASILDIGAGFHPELSGRENVYLNGQIHGFSKKEIEVKYDEIIEFSGIRKFINEPIKNYSNGMYLRLAFSIMVHLDFDVYLMDEVLSVGDENFRVKINSKLSNLNKTIVSVDHDLIRLSQLNPIFFELKNGKLAQLEYEIQDKKLKLKLFGDENFNMADCFESYNICLFPQVSDEKNRFLYNEPVIIKLRINNLKKKINVGISIKDQYGSHILDSIFDERIEELNPEINLEFPSSFFNARRYLLDFFVLENDKVILLEKEILQFVVEPCSSNGGWGVIHPSLNWTLNTN
jgi:lipopolysaccharide transport system ATP-binding protein